MNSVGGNCLAAAAVLCAQLHCAAAASYARDIMAAVFHQDTSQDAFLSARFEVFDRDGHSTTKNFSYRRVGFAGDNRTLVAFTDPAQIRGVALLSINRSGLPERQY